MRYVHLSQEHIDRSMVLYGAEPAKPKRVQSGSNESATFGDSSPVSVSESKGSVREAKTAQVIDFAANYNRGWALILEARVGIGAVHLR